MGQGVGLQGPRGQGVGLEGLRGSRGRLSGSQGSRGTPTGSQGVKGEAYRVPWGYRVGLMSLLMIHRAYMPVYK